jgi:hypothetical protein
VGDLPLMGLLVLSNGRIVNWWGVTQSTGRYGLPSERLRPVPASKHVQHSFARRSADSPRKARACRPVIRGTPRRFSPAKKRLLGQLLLA